MSEDLLHLLLERLEQEKRLQLSFSEEEILRAFFTHLPTSVHWTMKELTNHATVSIASISRLITKLNLHSYKEMQLALELFYQEVKESVLPKSTHRNPITEEITRIQSITKTNLDHFVKDLKNAPLTTFLTMLKESQFTIILSVGFSQFASDYLAYSLQIQGVNIQSVSMNLPSEIYWTLLKKCDLIIVISRSATTPSIKKKLEEAQSFKIPLVVITGNPKGTYAQEATLVLPIYDRNPYRDQNSYSAFQLKLFYLADIIQNLC
ncbi:MurR/RpiR family transcriptional regulator [Entomospira culicis]|uniref:MurR/RpiR family transcriptional regulator n=2 Tax=Entomospira culicis TaxID=2719989 RepID=A0A968KZI5_9SPIO|nr:MurR/RpiR family transcriptional regulator [Entomospira culicis]NIZ19167.1 MurR/RpiR family transcriptional regulator [Entomospira culicis]NIZ69381.1 MurR/RpiR family transcriptional regulator [Entomospira culicis]WDI36498.1 MurR/RpiR family transcriptional regulator [Entomospira culicis]